ncbi:NAD(P)-binding protein [Exidia glandulosa HHB12029]|uniref:NAD(P)-binding protein n=1 Tax=Exidia glandulosa HHB12029 TaxID=1314781 RepID=A0A165L0Y9_EXIGL|nr:NAD(P)-binding protein [Exidia glandulosa HHB12029]
MHALFKFLVVRIRTTRLRIATVSGASGFLGAHVVKALLARGYFVRGTVRTASKGDYLKKLFEVDWPSKFEYVVVEDIAFAGAFDDALESVDGVVHTASPVFAGPDDPPEALITPAVNGTLGLLHSIQARGPRVRRVVLTSSFAAMIEPRQGYYEYTEADWNKYSLREVETQGAAAGLHKYRAAKVLAERAFWDFLAKQEPRFDGVAINPPWIFGPVLHDVDAIERLNYSTKTLWGLLANEVLESSLATYVGNYTDVRDAAEVHVDAIEREDLAGRRLVFGCRGGAIAVQDFCTSPSQVYLALRC